MSNTGLVVFYSAEPVFLVIALLILWRSREIPRFPALLVYLLTRLVSDLAMTFLLVSHGVFGVSLKFAYPCYFWAFWASYLAGSIAIFFVLYELFQRALDPLPAVQKMGKIVFRWVAGISIVAVIAGVVIPGVPSGYQLLTAGCAQLMRSESVFTICVLFFLMLAVRKLGLSYANRVFGIGLGFGVLGAYNLVAAALLGHFSGNMWTSRLSIMSTAATFVALTIWVTYLLREEPARKPIVQPRVSSLARWNEIAASFGYSLNHASSASASTGRELFLHDVEDVVDRVLVKNSLHMTG